MTLFKKDNITIVIFESEGVVGELYRRSVASNNSINLLICSKLNKFEKTIAETQPEIIVISSCAERCSTTNSRVGLSPCLNKIRLIKPKGSVICIASNCSSLRDRSGPKEVIVDCKRLLARNLASLGTTFTDIAHKQLNLQQ